jgi:hypothetical protein
MANTSGIAPVLVRDARFAEGFAQQDPERYFGAGDMVPAALSAWC